MLLVLLVLLLTASRVLAGQPPEAGEGATALPVPALVAVGADLGFPAYRTVTARASLQARFVGVALRAGYGPGSGGYLGATLRGYPPIPASPVPVWVGAGLGATSAGAVPFAAVGAHLPVSPRWRLDIEAGVAWPELLDERRPTPHLSVGASYAFHVELDPAARPAAGAVPGSERSDRTGTACLPAPPDAARLDSALRDTVREFIADARATYGSLYDDLRYTFDVRDRELDGGQVTMRVAYDGSVREIATGRRISAAGLASVAFRWTGCSWRRTGLSY